MDGRSRRQLLVASGAAVSWSAGCTGLLGDGETDEPEESGPDDGPQDDSGQDDSTQDDGTRDESLGTYSQFQYDAGNTGSTTASGVDLKPSEQWQFREAPDDSSYGISSPAVAEETVFVCEAGTAGDTTEVTAYGLDPATGEPRWSNTVVTDSIRAQSMAYVDGTVVVYADTYYGLDPSDGTELWTYSRDAYPWHEPTIVDGSLYTIVREHPEAALVEIDGATGREQWRSDVEPTSNMQTAAGDDAIYVGSSDLRSYSYDGSPRWSAGLEHEVEGAPTVGPDAIYATGSERTVSAVSPDGEVRWQTRVEKADNRQGSAPMSTSPVLLDDTLYVYYVGRITALDVADGSKRWESDVNGGNNLLAAGGMLYVSSLNDLHAVDPGHGSRQWTVSTTASSGTKSTPAVVNGMIFFPSDGLYAYK